MIPLIDALRQKRQAYQDNPNFQARQAASDCVPNLSLTNLSTNVNLLQEELTRYFCDNISLFRDYYLLSFDACCNACLSGQYLGCSFNDPAALGRCGFDVNCLSNSTSLIVTSSDGCLNYASSMLAVISSLSNQLCVLATTATPTATNRTILDVIIDNAPAAVATAGGVGALATLIQPPPTLLTPQGIPSGNPLPGTPGGGAPPVASTPQAATAIGLAPPGTVPVAVFPPYDSARTLSAISVIFAENPSIVVQTRRQSLTRKVSRFASRGKSFF
jgi:hypothetical protein